MRTLKAILLTIAVIVLGYWLLKLANKNHDVITAIGTVIIILAGFYILYSAIKSQIK